MYCQTCFLQLCSVVGPPVAETGDVLGSKVEELHPGEHGEAHAEAQEATWEDSYSLPLSPILLTMATKP